MGYTRIINFQENWNRKLDNKVFTTIRKGTFPIENNSFVEITLKGKTYKHAKVVSATECYFQEIPTGILYTDTGLIGQECLDIFSHFGIDITNPNEKVYLYILESSELKPSYKDWRTNLKRLQTSAFDSNFM